jgi:hypothetical protein
MTIVIMRHSMRIFSIEFLNEKEPGAAATRLSQAGLGGRPKHRYLV